MRIFFFFSLMCLALVTSAQSIGNYVIVEMDTLDTSDPGVYRSPWRFSRADSTLYRWNYTSSQWQIANQGILDSIANIQSDLYPPSVDSSVQLIYLAAHGLDTANFTAGIIAVKENYALASAVSSDSVQFTYIIDTPHPDSIQVKGSGHISRPSHGLAVGKVYYLTNVAGVYDTIPGSVSSPVFFVLDINTIELLEQGAESSLIISRVPIPSPFITSYGGDPRSPSDTVIQQIAELYAMIGRARPGTVFVSQFSGSTANPTHQATGPAPLPSTPAHAWFWDGVQVTRILYAQTSWNLQDTLYGTLGNLPLVPVAAVPPTIQQVEDWITTNVDSFGISVPNGSLLYVVGTGTDDDPDYIWQVVDDVTGFGGLVKVVKVPFSTPQLETRGDSIGIVGGKAVIAPGDGYLPTALAAGSVDVETVNRFRLQNGSQNSQITANGIGMNSADGSYYDIGVGGFYYGKANGANSYFQIDADGSLTIGNYGTASGGIDFILRSNSDSPLTDFPSFTLDSKSSSDDSLPDGAKLGVIKMESGSRRDAVVIEGVNVGALSNAATTISSELNLYTTNNSSSAPTLAMKLSHLQEVVLPGYVSATPTTAAFGVGMDANGKLVKTDAISILSNTASLDFPSTANSSTSTLTMTLTGAAIGDPVTIAPASVPEGDIFFAWVSAADTVSVRFVNLSGGTVDPAAIDFTAQIVK